MQSRELKAEVIGYDGHVITLRAVCDDIDFMVDHKVKTGTVILDDGLHISGKQMRAIHATFRDIAEYQGETERYVKGKAKYDYWVATGFPLSHFPKLTMTQAGDFIDWLLEWCVENEIPLSEKLTARCDDIKRIIYACLLHKRCAVCGAPAELHHADAIGMGGDRKEAHHGGRLAMSLCRSHHTETHTISFPEFCQKYHVEPVKIDRRIAAKYKLLY
jgi:hypothetical protein